MGGESEIKRVLEQLNDLRILQINIKEIHLNPEDCDRLRLELEQTSRTPIKELVTLAGVKVVSDEKVQKGKVHIHQSEAIDYIGEIYGKSNLG